MRQKTIVPAAAGAPILDTGALLDAIPDSTAVLAGDGTIVAVNRAWRRFALENGGDPEHTDVGVNYIDVCQRSAASGCIEAATVERAVREVIKGGRLESDFEYPCQAAGGSTNWYMLRISRVTGPHENGAMVSHVNITRRKRAELDLARRATEDPFTGLANRLLFEQRLNKNLKLRPGEAACADVALIFIDLDGFKEVNDTYGHAAGDEILLEVSRRLKGIRRQQDTVARLGGDEFVLMAPRMNTIGLAGLVTKVAEILSAPYLVAGKWVPVGASLGSYLADRGDDAATALRRADEAMYAAKTLQGGTARAKPVRVENRRGAGEAPNGIERRRARPDLAPKTAKRPAAVKLAPPAKPATSRKP
jgi:diguanylate cyclase (GGDEF)-like protein